MPVKPYVIYDLEYATDRTARNLNWGGFGQHREVLQIAAAIVTPGEDWGNLPTFNQLVKPVYTEHNAFIEELTGISQQMLNDDGLDAEGAMQDFAGFVGNLPAFANGNDLNVLAETAGLQKFTLPVNPLNFASMHVPLYTALDTLCDFHWEDFPSGRLHQLLDIPLRAGLGQVHDALRDVWSLHVTLEALAQQGKDILSDLQEQMMLRKLRVVV